MSRRLTLAECGELKLLQALPEGRYAIEYSDSTHTGADQWIKLGHVDVRATNLPAAEDGIEQFYTLTCAPGPLPAAPGWNAEQAEARLRTIRDVLALALGRVGLLTPEVTPELFKELLALNEEDGVVIVPDTNALHNGAVHWLLRVLRRPSVWLLPVVASLTTVQTRDAMVKELVGQRKANKLVQVLRSRGLVNGALGLLQRNRGRTQVVEIDPSLLRYHKVGSSSGMDPDQSDVLEDRLIIEAIHSVLRSMRSRSARRVVTSDVNIARVLEAEGITTLFIPTIMLPEVPVGCLRFDAMARSFVGAPLRAVVWELAHVFGSIRLRRDDHVAARLDCYWPGKTPAQWAVETLIGEFAQAPAPPEADPAADQSIEMAREEAEVTTFPRTHVLPVLASLPRPLAAETGAEPRQFDDRSGVADRDTQRVENIQSARDKNSDARLGLARPSAARKLREQEITTALPRASFPQVLNLLGSAQRVGPATVVDIVASTRGDPVTVPTAKSALEILRRVGFLKFDSGSYAPTASAEAAANALAAADLDSISAMMLRFEPYRAFLNVLQDRGTIAREDVIEVLRGAVGKVGTYESERLPRYHTLLGQAWTRGDRILDGSQRPTDRDAADAFERAFKATASEGIASVIDLLPRFCENTRMSPWAAKRRIEGFVRESTLQGYAFQAAAGRRPITHDAVIGGTLDELRLDPVIVDRFQLGQRPVFTVERVTR